MSPSDAGITVQTNILQHVDSEILSNKQTEFGRILEGPSRVDFWDARVIHYRKIDQYDTSH
jgi:hypothetical protein